MNDLIQVLGTVAMEPKGEYDETAYYEKLNTVLYNDSTYMAIKSSHGVLPTDTEYWQLIGGGVTKEDLEEQLDSDYSFENFVLYAFFDDNNSDEIKLFVSKDNLHLQEIKLKNKIYGRDPSIIYYNNKFYIAITTYSQTHDFAIYESDDLINWEKHFINLGLYDSTYNNRWAPDFFIDDDNSLYVIISKQYSPYTEIDVYGKFKPYIAKCTDIDTFTFDTPVELVLSGTESDNFIDSICIKIDDTYHLIAKNDSQEVLTLEHFTSTDLLHFTWDSQDFGQFGRFAEGQFVYKFNNEYILAAERYYERDSKESIYRIKTSKDFINFSNYKIMYIKGLDISHGSAFVISNKKAKSMIFKTNDYNFKYDYNFVNYNDKKNFVVASNTTNYNFPKGRYLKIMSIKPRIANKMLSVLFKLTDVQRARFDSLIQFEGSIDSTDPFTATEYSLLQLSGKTKNYTSYRLSNLHGKLICVPNTTDRMYDLYLDLNSYSNDMTIMLDIISKNTYDDDITIYSEVFTDGLPITPVGINSAYSCKNMFPYYNNLYIDNGTNNKLVIKLCIPNSAFKVTGHGSNNQDNETYNYNVNTLNGTINAVNLNSSLTTPLTFTVDDYTNGIYTISITGLRNNSGFNIILPNIQGASILDHALSTI